MLNPNSKRGSQMAHKTTLRLIGRPSREPGGIIIDQFKIKIFPLEPSSLKPSSLGPSLLGSGEAPQNRKRIRANIMVDVAEPPAPDVPTEATPSPTESPVGELDSTPIPTESPVGELESVQPAPSE